MKKHGARFRTSRDGSAIHRALTAQSSLQTEQVTALALAFRTALECLRSGYGKEEHVHTLACSSNIALILAEQGYGSDAIEQIKAAQDGIVRCFARGRNSGKWGLDGQAITSLTWLAELHTEQIRLTSHKNMIHAINEVHRRMDAGLTLEEA
jgi:hypothetical protein